MLRRLGTTAIRARLGAMLRSLLMLICSAGLLIGAAIVIDPQQLRGEMRQPEQRTELRDLHREYAKTLADLISGCVEVLAVHEPGPSPYTEIVVWVDDQVNPGVIDPKEIAIISHSRLFHTITVYSMEPRSGVLGNAPSLGVGADELRDAAGALKVQPAPRQSAQELSARSGMFFDGAALSRDLVSQRSFCDRWRAAPAVQPRVIASGISDMLIERTGHQSLGLSLLRLCLRWTGDSTDGAKEASALIDLERRRSGAQE